LPNSFQHATKRQHGIRGSHKPHGVLREERDGDAATMARTSEMRKVICVGALSRGMFGPKKSW
jgi:hypothetical protein